MTTRTWDGGNGSFGNPNAWNPFGVPTAGDVAIINDSTVVASTPLSGLTVQVNAGANQTQLALGSGSSVAADATVSAVAAGAANVTIAVGGVFQNAGTLSFSGSSTGSGILSILFDTTLTNTGVIQFVGVPGQIDKVNGRVFVNNGVIALSNPSGSPKVVFDAMLITGTGTIRVGAGDTFQSAATLTGQTVFLAGANGVGANLELDDGGVGSSSTVSNFTKSDKITMVTRPYTAHAVVTNGGQTAVVLYNDNYVVGRVTLQGVYADSALNFALSATTATSETTTITTTMADTALTGAVYRFFDSSTGTHFFTSDVGERNTVLASLRNYVEEINGFGDVTQTDPNAQAVYRFFDTVHGTHFFTASASERDGIIATRSDLTYEPNSTVYENSVALPGDVAVYRFFDTKLGTHFYTGDQNEFTGLTTAGSSPYRSDLTYEGISFYAPAGSYK